MRILKLRCSFCRKDESRVAKLVAGPRLALPRVYICDKCAREAIRIMESAPTPPGALTAQRV